MPFSLIPDRVYRSIFEITGAKLAAQGIGLLLADLDNTLAKYGQKEPDGQVSAWKDALAAAGVELFLLSNSRKPRRAEHFARALGIPALVNGLIDNDFRKTAEAVFRITREKNTGGVQIDPMQFAKYGITSVPALVVTCGERYDLIRGNIRLKAALERVAKEGECAPVAEAILRESER